MARTSYFAPGVYVEEVPSAEKPIAGVGTNTAAFVGVIAEDSVECPVTNEDYDPVHARTAAEEYSEEALPIAIKKLDEKIAELRRAGGDQQEPGRARRDRRPEPAAAAAAAGAEAPVPEPARPDVRGGEGPLAALEARRAQLKAIQDAGRAIRELVKRRDEKRRSRPGSEQEKAALAAEIAALEEEIGQKRDDRIGQVAAAMGDLDRKHLKAYEVEPREITAQPGEWKLCVNFTDYRNRFGDFSLDEPHLPGKARYPGHRALTHAVYGFFQNGGTRCFVSRVKNIADVPRALEACESIDAVALVAAPGMSDAASYDALTSHCERCEDRFAILDPPELVESVPGELDINLLNYDAPEGKRVIPTRDRNAAFYFPWIRCLDRAKLLQDQDPARDVEPKSQGMVWVAPSGHIAGIYAKTDEERGVHKAPANAVVRGALGVKYYIGKTKQELLNPQGVNCIRDLNGANTVWGARTVGGDKNAEYKYVNVRRVLLFLKESIDEGTQWAVFEPNDRDLWAKLRRNVSAFLTNVWRTGALFGSTPEEAFYVKCDDELNPPEVRDLGIVITEIGVAIVRPAEFVVFRIQQTSGKSVQ